MSTDCRWNTDSSSLEYNRVAPSAIASTSTSYFSSEPGIGRLSFSQLCEVSMDYQGKPAIRTFDRDLLVFTARPQNTSFIYPYRAPGRGYLPVLPWTSREGDVESSTRNSKSNKQLPDCKICGEKSVGCHYGVYVCVACKGFFKRQSKGCRILACVQGDGKCMVSGRDHRRKCGYCRFEVCKRAGMSKLVMRRGRYSSQANPSPSTTIRKESGNPFTLKTYILDKVKSERSNSVCSDHCFRSCGYISGNGFQSPQDGNCNGQMLLKGMNKHDKISPFTFSSVDHYLFSQKGYNNTGIRPSKHLNIEPFAVLPFGHTFFLRSGQNTTCAQYDMAQRKPFLNHNKFTTNTSADLPIFTRLCEASERDCPYSADIETLVGTLLRQIEKFVDIDTYTDEKKLTSLQRRSHDAYGSVRDPNTCCSASDECIKDESPKIYGSVHTIIDDLVKGFIDAAHFIPGFPALPRGDKASLFKANAFEAWMCIYHMCFSKELQVVCTEKFHIHRSFMSAVLGERTANQMWLLADELKVLQLSKYQIPVVWAITLLNPDRQVYDHSPDIMVLRDKMLTCLDYLCRRNQPDGKRMILRVFATVRDLYSASNEFNHIFFK